VREVADPTIRISDREIGGDKEPYVIAEVGVHHRNDLELAKAYVLEAKRAGADAAKFQTYSADRLAARWAPTYWDDGTGRTQHDIFSSRSLLTRDDYEALFAFASELEIHFLSTPFDTDAARMLEELGMPAYKIASADITDLPLLRVVASFGKPVLLSTGASTFDEVRTAVDAVTAAGAPCSLLHCTLTYPTPLADANLARITALKEAFPDLVIGYSDHTQPQDSELACPISVALGARIVEKHFTLDKSLPEDDHYHAVDPEGLSRLVRDCRVAALETSSYREISDSELAARAYARRSIVAAHPLAAGAILGAADIDFKRPGTGMSPAMVDAVLGRRLTRDLEADELVAPEDLED
jgi:N-acetylneuraminate synthase